MHGQPVPASTPPVQRGFTLVELMIAVVVVALLAAVALPSFMDSIRKSRRSEAFAALMAVQQAQERWRGNNASYANGTDLFEDADADPPRPGLKDETPNRYYRITISAPTATGYIVTATAQDGTSQAADTQCATLGVQLDGGNLTYAGGSGDLAYAPTHPCWAR